MPLAAVHGHAKVWWRFAYKCIVETDIRRRKREWSWVHIRAHRDRCRRYATVYEKRLLSRKVAKETLDACEQMECAIDLFNLRLIRQHVDVMVLSSGALDEPEPAASSWFGGWWGGWSKADDAAAGANSDISK